MCNCSSLLISWMLPLHWREVYIVTFQRQHHRRFLFISQTLQTLHNDSLTTVDLIHYIDDKGVEVCLTGC